MKTLLKASIVLGASAAALLPVAASAQRAPAAVIVVVDRGRALNECNACKTASAALKTQVDQIQARQTALATPLEAEGKALQTAITALNGKEPDAALRARAAAFDQKRATAGQELEQRQQTFARNRVHVASQIEAKIGPIVSTIMKAKGANLALDAQSVQTVVAYEPVIDITNEVLAQLNVQLPSVSTTAPAPTAQPAQPARPTGR